MSFVCFFKSALISIFRICSKEKSSYFNISQPHFVSYSWKVPKVESSMHLFRNTKCQFFRFGLAHPVTLVFDIECVCYEYLCLTQSRHPCRAVVWTGCGKEVHTDRTTKITNLHQHKRIYQTEQQK